MSGYVTPPESWSTSTAVGSGVTASVARATASAGQKHICTGIYASVASTGTAGTVQTLQLLSGTTPIWQKQMAPGPGTPSTVDIPNLYIAAASNSRLALAFASGNGVGTYQSVTLTGVTVAS